MLDGRLLLPVPAKTVENLIRVLGRDPDHRPHRIRQGHPRHVEGHRGRVGPLGELRYSSGLRSTVIRTGFERIAVCPAGRAPGSARRAAAAANCAFRRSRGVVMTALSRADGTAR